MPTVDQDVFQAAQTTTPTSTTPRQRVDMSMPSDEQLKEIIDRTVGFSPLTVVKMEHLGLSKLLKGMKPDAAGYVRSQLRNIVSAANKIADEGPQGLRDRIDAIKYAANLPSNLGARFRRMRAIQSGEEMLTGPVEKQLGSYKDFVSKIREDVGFAMKLMQRKAGPGLQQIATKAGQEVEQVAGKAVKLRPKDLDITGQYLLDTPGLKERVKGMLRIANRSFEHEGQIVQAGPGNPETRALALREALGFPSKLRHQLKFLRGEMDKISAKGPMMAQADQKEWQMLADRHGEINNALEWGRKLFEHAQDELMKLK